VAQTMRVEIKIVNDTGEFTILRHQPRDKVSRKTRSQLDTLKDAYADAQVWLRKNGNSESIYKPYGAP
jgi:hypothetical protein